MLQQGLYQDEADNDGDDDDDDEIYIMMKCMCVSFFVTFLFIHKKVSWSPMQCESRQMSTFLRRSVPSTLGKPGLKLWPNDDDDDAENSNDF